MNITVIDCSHRDRPSLHFEAQEVISRPNGTIVIGARAPWTGDTHVTAIDNLVRDIRTGCELDLSTDWVVKAY